MFRIHRHRSDRYGDKFDFRFTNLNASQIPKGWDRLVISLVSIETGKTVAKSNKAVVRNGSCQWPDSFKETILVAQDDVPKETEEGHLKLVISTGSPRSSVLGEAILNLNGYVNAHDAATVSLPLKRCAYGTILQLQVQGVSAKTGFRDGLRKHLREFRSQNENQMADMDDLDSRSDGSDIIYSKSLGSSSNHLGSGSYNDELGHRELSLSASGSHRSSDSGDSFIARANISPKNSIIGGTHNKIVRQDSISSPNSAGNGIGFGDETFRSNNSSFDSRTSGSQWQEGQNSLNEPAARPVDSSKELLEAAQETIEELRREARMWEKTARKLKNDLEALRREFSDQANYLGVVDKELSAACSERDNLKVELEQLKVASDEPAAKQVTSDASCSLEEDVIRKLEELEEEVKFQKESNATLSRQLTKTQESNYELLSILQELEETVEKQRAEIASFSLQTPKSDIQRASCDNSADLESEEACQFITKEKILESSPLGSSEKISVGYIDAVVDLVKEVEALKVKVGELERDCAELTEENIELLYKLKEFKKGTLKIDSDYSQSNSFHYSISHGDGVRPGHNEDTKGKEMSADLLIHFQELEKKCTNLETDLEFFKDKARELGVKLQMTQLDAEQKNIEIDVLQRRLETYQQVEQSASDALNFKEMSVLLTEMYKELQRPISRVKDSWFEYDPYVSTENSTSIDIDCATPREKAETILHNIAELDKFLYEKIADCKILFQNESMETSDKNHMFHEEQDDPTHLNDRRLKINSNFQKISPPFTEDNLFRDSASDSALHEEIVALKLDNGKLEDLIGQLNDQNIKLENNLEAALRAHNNSSKSLDDAQEELLQLARSMESQIAANKLLERKLSETESGKHELEINVAELEQENVHLSERISGLEAQLRYMTNEKESNRLEVENSKSLYVNLKNDISKLEDELEAQKSELKQKVQETHRRLLEAQEESEFLKRSHSKLEATIESLIDESSSLEKLNGDLRRQKLELNDKCTLLEVELSKSHEKGSDFMEQMVLLESKLLSFQNDMALKERSLISQLEVLCQENKENKENLVKAHMMLKMMETEKMVEVENLQREVAILTAQISATDDERQILGSDALHELSTLRAEKSKLENNIKDLLAKVQSYETDICSVRNESENKLQGLIGLLNASKQSEDMLMADIEHMRKLMEDTRCKEEKTKRAANELELKLKTSENEIEHLKEDISSLKLQLQRIPQLQDEILSLKNTIDSVKFEKSKIEEELHLLSGEFEEVKAEKNLYLEKMTTMQKALSDSEDAKLSKVTLEEKLLRLECDLTAREALSANEAELKNEVTRMKRTNSQYQRRIQSLEEEKDELERRVHDLAEVSKLKKDDKPLLRQGDISPKEFIQRSSSSGMFDLDVKIKKLEKELEEALQRNILYQKELENLQAVRQHANSSNSETAPTEDRGDGGLSPLEAELKEMRERYSEMSLKYAEVEAEREELVMKLKSSKSQKRWF